MDAELKLKTQSRDLDPVEGVHSDDNPNGRISEDAHVLSNLLQSLEASAGETGPVQNMLTGMGSNNK
jgi:hypothetical protein